MKLVKKKFFCSFDKNYSIFTKFSNLTKYKEIEIIKKYNDNFINVGSNLSYAPLAFSKKSTTIFLDKFNRILNFNLKNKEITVEAGITFAELLEFTLKYNLWIPQIPGYPFITLGGAIASNAHGKSCANDGSIRNSIKSIKIFHKKNGWLNLSNKENKEIFELTLGGIGLTGTIVNVTLKLKSIQSVKFITKKIKVSSLHETIKLIKEKTYKKNSFVYSWNMATNKSNLGKGIVFENILCQENETTNFKKETTNFTLEKKILSPPQIFFSIWNKYSLLIANEIYYQLNSSNKNENENFIEVIFPFYGREMYFYLFGKTGFFESQLLIPDNKLDDFLDEFKFLYNKFLPVITLLSFKNMSGEQNYIRFEGEMICMTLDFVNNKKNKLFMDEIDKLCIKYNIIPSIIKDSRLTKTVVEKCYKKFDEFKSGIKKFDINRFYKSEISEKLGI